MRRRIWAAILSGAVIALALAPAAEAAAKSKAPISAEAGRASDRERPRACRLVTFPETGWSPVKVVRGGVLGQRRQGQRRRQLKRPRRPRSSAFGDSKGRSVQDNAGRRRPIRMPTAAAPGGSLDDADRHLRRPEGAAGKRAARLRCPEPADIELFGPASIADLDRVAFAVDGAEIQPRRRSQNVAAGAERPARADAGHSGRRDRCRRRGPVRPRAEPRSGRAYLARMYRRYGNWPDAIAAYNWGPGNVDSWISGGRPAHKFPLEVERYRDRVMREAALGNPASVAPSGGWPSQAVAPRGLAGSTDY